MPDTTYFERWDCISLLGIYTAFGLLPEGRWFGLTGLCLALALITAGQLSSTFHLGHPEHAWRAVTQWRSSWLSREGGLALSCLFGVVVERWLFFAEAEHVEQIDRRSSPPGIPKWAGPRISDAT